MNISEKNCIQVGISTGTNIALAIVTAVSAIHRPTFSVSGHFIYTAQESDTYEFIIFVNYMNS